jgi:hypothetical protein
VAYTVTGDKIAEQMKMLADPVAWRDAQQSQANIDRTATQRDTQTRQTQKTIDQRDRKFKFDVAKDRRDFISKVDENIAKRLKGGEFDMFAGAEDQAFTTKMADVAQQMWRYDPALTPDQAVRNALEIEQLAVSAGGGPITAGKGLANYAALIDDETERLVLVDNTTGRMLLVPEEYEQVFKTAYKNWKGK